MLFGRDKKFSDGKNSHGFWDLFGVFLPDALKCVYAV